MMLRSTHRSWLTTSGLLCATLLTGACATLSPRAKDDDNPELTKRAGPRASVVVADNAFAYSGSAGGAEIVVDGPDGPKRYSWSVRSTGFSWSKERGQQLEVFFRQALAETGAFYVIQREAIDAARSDRALEREGLQAAEAGGAKLMRPDLQLVCTITKLEDNAEKRQDDASVSAWNYVPIVGGYLAGSGQRATQKGVCEIMVEVFDRASGVTIATAKGEGFAVGGSQSARAANWQRGIFGGLGTSSEQAVDMSAAIQRATTRAVNDLVAKVPAGYFRHELDLGAPVDASVAAAKR